MTEDHARRLTPEDAELAANLAAEQIGNIEAAIFTLGEALTAKQEQRLAFMMYQQIYRMCLSWLILTAAKVEEIWQKYSGFAEPYTRDRMKAVLREIKSRGMTDVRNTMIAHVLDRKTSRPPAPEQVQETIQTMMRGDLLAFAHWLRHPEDPKTDTVSRALRLFRADILKQFPDVRITMPVSTYSTPMGDFEH